MKKIKITSKGLDSLILSEKMETIEELTLDNGGYAFPAFYESEHCKKLYKINADFSDVTSECLEILYILFYNFNRNYKFAKITQYIE